MLNDSPEFAAADARLNNAWKALGEISPKDRTDLRRRYQRKWSSAIRDRLVREVVAAGEAGAPYPDARLEPVLRNDRVDLGLAYAKITDERAVYLEELARQQRDKSRVAVFEGLLGFSHGAFTFRPDGWWSRFIFCYPTDDPAARDAQSILEGAVEAVKVRASGRLSDGYTDDEGVVFGFDFKNSPDTLKVERVGDGNRQR